MLQALKNKFVRLQNTYVNPLESKGKGKVDMNDTDLCDWNSSRFNLRVQLNVPLGIF